MSAAHAESQECNDFIARISAVPKSYRTEAALADEVLDYAARLPDNSIEFARFKAGLKRLGVQVPEWKKAVQQRRSETSQVTQPALEAGPKDVPRIVINKMEEYEVNEAAVEAVAQLPNLYQRFGLLVRVIEHRRRRPGRRDSEIVREIQQISPPLLRELFTRAATWCEERRDPETGMPVFVPAHPPEWSVNAVHDWRTWPHIKPLYHISEIPVLLPDGSLLSEPGYNDATGILYQPRTTVPDIPETPTEADVQAAKEMLLDLVAEVPFETDAHRSAWLAALLTPIARWAFEGQSPLFMFDANQAGSGKGLLLRVIGLLALGHHMDLITATANEEEERKRITAKILSGATMVVIDNIGSIFGSQIIEALLTTDIWSERLLGSNEAPRLDTWITWYGSGNNVQYARDDTRRRVCTIRILTNEERPEERSGFKYESLEKHVLQHRGELLAATLVLLRGWLRTGQRASSLAGWGGPWGSFDDWDQVVRGAVVYAGLPDPIAVKATKGPAGVQETGLRELVEGLEEAMKELKRPSVSAEQIIFAMNENDEWRRCDRKVPLRFKKLRSAISLTMKKLPHGQLPNQNQLGTLFGRFKMQPSNGKRIAFHTIEGENRWYVEPVPKAPDIEREAIVAEGNQRRSAIGPDGRCAACDADAHKPCGRCSKCRPELGGCECGSCVTGGFPVYVQTGPCNLCGKRDCRCGQCGRCRNIGFDNGGCCC